MSDHLSVLQQQQSIPRPNQNYPGQASSNVNQSLQSQGNQHHLAQAVHSQAQSQGAGHSNINVNRPPSASQIPSASAVHPPRRPNSGGISAWLGQPPQTQNARSVLPQAPLAVIKPRSQPQSPAIQSPAVQSLSYGHSSQAVNLQQVPASLQPRPPPQPVNYARYSAISLPQPSTTQLQHGSAPSPAQPLPQPQIQPPFPPDMVDQIRHHVAKTLQPTQVQFEELWRNLFNNVESQLRNAHVQFYTEVENTAKACRVLTKVLDDNKRLAAELEREREERHKMAAELKEAREEVQRVVGGNRSLQHMYQQAVHELQKLKHAEAERPLPVLSPSAFPEHQPGALPVNLAHYPPEFVDAIKRELNRDVEIKVATMLAASLRGRRTVNTEAPQNRSQDATNKAPPTPPDSAIDTTAKQTTAALTPPPDQPAPHAESTQRNVSPSLSRTVSSTSPQLAPQSAPNTTSSQSAPDATSSQPAPQPTPTHLPVSSQPPSSTAHPHTPTSPATPIPAPAEPSSISASTSAIAIKQEPVDSAPMQLTSTYEGGQEIIDLTGLPGSPSLQQPHADLPSPPVPPVVPHMISNLARHQHGEAAQFSEKEGEGAKPPAVEAGTEDAPDPEGTEHIASDPPQEQARTPEDIPLLDDVDEDEDEDEPMRPPSEERAIEEMVTEPEVPDNTDAKDTVDPSRKRSRDCSEDGLSPRPAVRRRISAELEGDFYGVQPAGESGPAASTKVPEALPTVSPPAIQSPAPIAERRSAPADSPIVASAGPSVIPQVETRMVSGTPPTPSTPIAGPSAVPSSTTRTPHAPVAPPAPVNLPPSLSRRTSAQSPASARQPKVGEFELTYPKPAPVAPVKVKAEEPDSTLQPEPKPARSRLGIQHIALVYHASKTKYTCRFCLLRHKEDPSSRVTTFPISASGAVLSAHCEKVHPTSCGALLKMTPAELTEARQQVQNPS
ncbi:hypothetical protein GLOTRDRAFT_136587 [Gloeophyllum trabeum ATCC 11539]|uniref:Uncharacterized protein n=1 Tax=Gloeophyllum trabeum (strain ATCC 11539 / FP-39264 / Madison 617) TaxID=670483 RepID=S7QKQ1_GLOTA|nr:uncharacterized protein GLOTRDRAFT_136587 [Gloeophyllum trabeum ATCC 11539]EPQ59833.1 hypothetical protein GLOTRDRAFT_136587 [Gloeophyllum trabeum ATCC 11539]